MAPASSTTPVNVVRSAAMHDLQRIPGSGAIGPGLILKRIRSCTSTELPMN
jgi:hypothetical protein